MYEQIVLHIKHRTFTPLVLSSSGGWSPLPRLPKETGWPHCHQAQSVVHHSPELHQVQDCLLTNSVSSHVPAWTEIPFHAPPSPSAWRTTPWTSSTRRSIFRIASLILTQTHLFYLLINPISLSIVFLINVVGLHYTYTLAMVAK